MDGWWWWWTRASLNQLCIQKHTKQFLDICCNLSKFYPNFTTVTHLLISNVGSPLGFVEVSQVGNYATNYQLILDCSGSSVDSAAAIGFDESSTATDGSKQKPPFWKYCFSWITRELITSMCFPRFSRSRIYNMEVMLSLAHCFSAWRGKKKYNLGKKNCCALIETLESLSTSLSELLFHSCWGLFSSSALQ